MDAEGLVLAVLDAMPDREVRGKKRLQKLAFFAVQAGAPSTARFSLHNFGPFSPEIAGATDLLAFVGDISESEAQFTQSKRFLKVYGLTEISSVPEALPETSSRAIRALNEYSTIELEIASTMLYFISQGNSPDDAIEATKELKPEKSQPKIIQRAKEALLKVGLYERGRANSLSGSRPHQL